MLNRNLLSYMVQHLHVSLIDTVSITAVHSDLCASRVELQPNARANCRLKALALRDLNTHFRIAYHALSVGDSKMGGWMRCSGVPNASAELGP